MGHTLPLLQSKALPRGTAEFEVKRAELLQAFNEKVPREYYIPHHLIEHPPTDVSGIPATLGILTPAEIDITEKYDAVALADAIARRQYTAVAVATAFAKRAIIAHQLTGCLTQWMMDDAVEQAARLDLHLDATGTTVGPLHGVPVSIKDHLPIAGTSSSTGSFGSVVRDDADCHLVAILRGLGAVFYCKTNQPQSLMHLESDSHWGRVLNPYNIHLSAGGSTGGEAALVAMRGSVLGVGTDIGGSIRGPSAFCGIYGFKPTAYTLPMKDALAAAVPAELNVLCSIGPMCRSLRDMDFFTRHVLATRPHRADPRLVPIPWTGLRTPVAKRLKVGLIAHDGFIDPQPPVKRALAWARQRLADPRHADRIDLKAFQPYRAAEAWATIRRLYWPDGASGIRDAIQATGEPVHPLSEWIWQDAAPAGMQTAASVSEMRRERDQFRCAFADSWAAQDVDVVLGPAFVGPASAHDTALYWTYTSLYNLVDYPGVVIPTPVKVEPVERYAADYVPLSDACRHVQQLWESSNFEGAPIDLQVVAPKYHDNDLFGALTVLQEVLDLP